MFLEGEYLLVVVNLKAADCPIAYWDIGFARSLRHYLPLIGTLIQGSYDFLPGTFLVQFWVVVAKQKNALNIRIGFVLSVDVGFSTIVKNILGLVGNIDVESENTN